MERWAGGKWVRSHFVLTRAGFLHWFAPPPPQAKVTSWESFAGTAANSLNLSRCSFEEGEAAQNAVCPHLLISHYYTCISCPCVSATGGRFDRGQAAAQLTY
jgi:hypothetical protein